MFMVDRKLYTEAFELSKMFGEGEQEGGFSGDPHQGGASVGGVIQPVPSDALPGGNRVFIYAGFDNQLSRWHTLPPEAVFFWLDNSAVFYSRPLRTLGVNGIWEYRIKSRLHVVIDLLMSKRSA